MKEKRPKRPPRRGEALPYNWGSTKQGNGNGFKRRGRSRSLRRLAGESKRLKLKDSVKQKLLEFVGRGT